MSSLLLSIMSYPGANEGVERHFPYYEKAKADKMLGIGTTCGKCKWPDGIEPVEISKSDYINGHHLPKRLVETMKLMLLLPFDRYVIIEWDCLFFQPMAEFTGMVGFQAGGQLPGMRAHRFYHVPWGFDYESGQKFVGIAERLFKSGEVHGHECSPDVFFGFVLQEGGIPCSQPWEGFTRNTIESAEDAELARQARINGAMAIHGIKSKAVLEHILS